MPVAIVATEDLDEVLTERMKPSRVLDQFRLSDVCERLPKMRERSSDAMPMSLSVHVRLPPPFRPTFADATPFVIPAFAPASPPRNQAVLISSAARRDRPNWRCRFVEAWSTSLKAVWMLSELDRPVAVSKLLPRLNGARSSRALVMALFVDSVARLA